MEIGFLGLGQMGKAIAANLIRAGHRLRVWNRSAAAAQEVAALGATVAAEPAAAARAEVLMTMLADDEANRAVLLGAGVLDGAPRGLIHVNLATVSVALARELAGHATERGITYLAAPVFGRPEVAQAGRLNVVVAGDQAAISRVEPLLAAIGERTWPVGSPPERANVVKLAGNFMIACALEAMGEAGALVRAHGIAAGEMLEVLTNTLFAAPVYKTYGRLIAEQRYHPAAFKMALGAKDVRLALEAGQAAHVPLPFASLLRDHFLEALAAGGTDYDWAALAEIPARHAGLPSPMSSRQAP
jgi:3-hydroxyisobutyrate dehydrogenase-like beta-hydroxyacid dehydrogenase